MRENNWLKKNQVTFMDANKVKRKKLTERETEWQKEEKNRTVNTSH